MTSDQRAGSVELVIARPHAPKLKWGWPAVLLGAGALALPGAAGAAGGGLLLLIAGGAWLALRVRARRRAITTAAEWSTAAEQRVTDVLNADALPEIPVAFALKPGEVCYWEGDAEWHELRSKRLSYSGVSVSVPIVKGVRYRAGTFDYAGGRSEMTHLDSGTLYITNQRLFFDGREKNVTLAYSAVASVTLAQDGIVIDRHNGRSPYLTLRGDAPKAAAIIARHLGA